MHKDAKKKSSVKYNYRVKFLNFRRLEYYVALANDKVTQHLKRWNVQNTQEILCTSLNKSS